MPYTSSLTDKEWEIIEPLLPRRKREQAIFSSTKRGNRNEKTNRFICNSATTAKKNVKKF